jgi:hypothetical protein
MFLSRCAANISHAFAMTSRERLLSRIIKRLNEVEAFLGVAPIPFYQFCHASVPDYSLDAHTVALFPKR